MMIEEKVYLSIGSNIGDRESNIASSIAMLGSYIEISKMLLSILNPKEKKLINLRYGLDADRRHTLFDIYEMNQYKNYKELFEELTRALWKLKICWPNEILYKLLFCCEET